MMTPREMGVFCNALVLAGEVVLSSGQHSLRYRVQRPTEDTHQSILVSRTFLVGVLLKHWVRIPAVRTGAI